MSEGKKNMDLYFDEKLKNALKGRPSEYFSNNLMHKVSQEIQFAQEDKKTEKVTFKLMGSIALVMIGLTIAFGFFFARSTPDTTAETSMIEDFTITINKILYDIQSAIGVTFDVQTILFVLTLLLIIAVFTASDKFIFKKR
ncbi:MAG: hypothetical protein KDC73_04520 [Ignavibacteriae bacterium]|nr:hypothetical protein [Ignavibacteriota bacterium]MCB0723942.1 hypothetical protein [Ignavibacteriota bacterium]MCB9244013.1 hypothetical protein [Ignavibacteriales bacterium]